MLVSTARIGLLVTGYLTLPDSPARFRRRPAGGGGDRPVRLGRTLGGAPGRAQDCSDPIRAGFPRRPVALVPPMGGGGAIGPHLLSADAVTLLERGRCSCVLWNAVFHNWAEPDAWMETALAQISQQNWTLKALHGLPTGAMAQLDRFLDQVMQRDVNLRQDFPLDCVPILDGFMTGPIDRPAASPLTATRSHSAFGNSVHDEESSGRGGHRHAQPGDRQRPSHARIGAARLRWTSPSMPSTACWNRDTRLPSASIEPPGGAGVTAPGHHIGATRLPAGLRLRGHTLPASLP